MTQRYYGEAKNLLMAALSAMGSGANPVYLGPEVPGEDLLHAQRPLLVPRTRQAERLVPRRQLNGSRTSVLAQRDSEHLEQDSLHVVLGLCLGETE